MAHVFAALMLLLQSPNGTNVTLDEATAAFDAEVQKARAGSAQTPAPESEPAYSDGCTMSSGRTARSNSSSVT